MDKKEKVLLGIAGLLLAFMIYIDYPNFSGLSVAATAFVKCFTDASVLISMSIMMLIMGVVTFFVVKSDKKHREKVKQMGVGDKIEIPIGRYNSAKGEIVSECEDDRFVEVKVRMNRYYLSDQENKD